MPVPPSSQPDPLPEKWGDRPAMQLPRPYAGRGYLPNRGQWIYFNDGPKMISAREARAIRKVARQFDVPLQGIDADTEIAKGQPFALPSSRQTYAGFMSLGTTYRSGVGAVVGENQRRYLDAWGKTGVDKQADQRPGYFDQELGWVPFDDPSSTGVTSPSGPAVDPNNPNIPTIGGAVAPNGQFVSPNRGTATQAFINAKDAAYEDLLRDRERLGVTSALTNAEAQALNEEATRRANEALKAYVAGDPNNGPVDNLLDSTAVAEFKAGQFLPQFTGYTNQRRLTDREVRGLNFLKAGNVPGSDDLLADLLDPSMPEGAKTQALNQVLGYKAQVEAQAPTVQEQNTLLSALTSWWNPLTWGPRIAFEGLSLLDSVYQTYVDPSATWALSALPGGPRTLTFEEAQQIPVGQLGAQMTGQYAPIVAGQFNRAGVAFAKGNVLQGIAEGAAGLNPTYPVTTAMGIGLNMLQGSDAMDAAQLYQLGLSGGQNPEAAMPWVGQPVSRIFDPEYRKATFEDNAYGSGTSGTIGFNTVLIWDPLNVAGPTGKVLRVSHRLGMGAGMIVGERGMKRFVTDMDIAQLKYQGFDEAKRFLKEARLKGDPEMIDNAEKALATARMIKNREVRGPFKGTNVLTKFTDWILDPANGKVRTPRQIASHSVIKGMPNAAEVSVALSMAETAEDVGLILRSQAGDLDAVKLLKARNERAAKEIELISVNRSMNNWIASPDDFQKAQAAIQVQVTNALDEFLRTIETTRMSTEDLTELARLVDVTSEESLTASLDTLRTAREIGIADPVAYDRMFDQVSKAEDALQDLLYGAPAQTWTEQTWEAFRKLRGALDREREVATAELYLLDETPEALDMTARRLKDLEKMNEMYRLTLASDGGLLGNRVNFGTGNWQSGAKWRESARQRRAERQTRQRDTHRISRSQNRPDPNDGDGKVKRKVKQLGASVLWVPTTFKANGVGSDGTVTVWTAMQGARDVAADALTRPFTYAAAEAPAYYLPIKGMSGDSGYREVEAILNSIAMYADKSMNARKDQIFERYVRHMNDPSVPNYEVYTRLEKDITHDMARYYAKGEGLDDEGIAKLVREMTDIYKIYDGRRYEIIQSIKTKGFWKDEEGRVHKSPMLESQLIDHTPTLDFRMLERRTRDLAKGRAKYGVDRVKQEPEGFFRKRAEHQEGVIRADKDLEIARAKLSNAQAEGAGKDVLKPLKANVKKLEKDFEAAVKLRDEAFADPTIMQKAAHGVVVGYNAFNDLWRPAVLLRTAYPVRNTIDGTARRFLYSASIGPIIEDIFTGTRNAATNVAQGRNVPLPSGRLRDSVKDRNAGRALKQMQESGKIPKRVARWVERERALAAAFRDNQVRISDEAGEQVAYLQDKRRLMHTILSEDDMALLDRELYEIDRNRRLLDSTVAEFNKKIDDLDRMGPADLTAAYRQSLDRPRRIGDEMVQGVDGRTYWGVRSDPYMGPIMESNASAGETMQAVLGLNLSISTSVMRAGSLMMGGVVSKGNANYMNSLVQIMNMQIRNSVPGRMWLNGSTVDEIAEVLMDPEKGAKYRDMVTESRAKDRAKEDARRGPAYEAKAEEARKAVDEAAEIDSIFSPGMVGALATDADRSVSLLSSIDTDVDRSISLLSSFDTDADRSVSLLSSIEVQGYGRLAAIADFTKGTGFTDEAAGAAQGSGGSRSVHVRLKYPAIASPGQYSPQGEGWRFAQFERAEAPATDALPALERTEPGVRERPLVQADIVGEAYKPRMGEMEWNPKWGTDPRAAIRPIRMPGVTNNLTTPPKVHLRVDDVYVNKQGRLYFLVGPDKDFEPWTLGGNLDTFTTHAQLPEKLYHVTVRAEDVRDSGVLRVTEFRDYSRQDKIAGIGDDMKGTASFYASREHAEAMANDMRFIAAVKSRLVGVSNEPTRGIDDAMDVIYDEWAALATEHHSRTGRYSMVDEYDSLRPEALDKIRQQLDRPGPVTAETNWARAQREFFMMRREAFGIRQSPIQDVVRYRLDPADIEVIEVSKAQIPPQAVALRYGDDEIPEFEIFSDIPLEGSQWYRAAPETPITPMESRKIGSTPETPEVPDARMEAQSLVDGRNTLAAQSLVDGTNTLAVQAMADAIRGEGLGFRVSVLSDGRTLSIGLPKVTEELRSVAFNRAHWDKHFRSEKPLTEAYDDMSDGLEMLHTFNRIENIDDARFHAEFLTNEFARYIPDEQLRQLLAMGPVRKQQVEAIYKDRTDLLPHEIHGSQLSRDTGGENSVMAWFRKQTNKGFTKLGTLPEDRLVRFPFMSQRYTEMLRVGTGLLAAKYPNGAPAWAVESVIQMSRKRALKDVQDYLYTQPRRTNLGRVGERFVPFIAAWQNSAMAMGKMVSSNPETLMYMEKAWRAPDQIGMTDEDGNVRIPIPSWMIGKTFRPPGVGKFTGEIPLTGVAGDEWVYDKKSIYVLPQAIDPIISWKLGPIYQITASTIFQAGWAGPVVPRLLQGPLDAVFGEGTAQEIWDGAILATFGVDEFGRDEGRLRSAAMSDKPLGANLALPPAAQKALSVLTASFGNNPGNDNSYAVAYVNIARDEMLKYLSGQRETEPQADEIRDRTNGLFTIRGLSNFVGITGGPLGIVTPPQADYMGADLVQLYRMVQDTHGYDQADEIFMSLFGDEVLGLVKRSSTQGVSQATNRSMEIGEAYQPLIDSIGSRMIDSGLLSWVYTNGLETQDSYNPNVRMLQKFRDVPGTKSPMREVLSPQETELKANESRGWTAWIHYKRAQQAQLEARGIKSLQSAAAADLLADQRAWLARAENDPLYYDWYVDYNGGFAQRNLQARTLLRTFTGDDQWMGDPKAGGNPRDMWITADQWTAERDEYKRAFDRANGDEDAQRSVKNMWAERSEEIARTNSRFSEFYFRYLEDDDLKSK